MVESWIFLSVLGLGGPQFVPKRVPEFEFPGRKAIHVAVVAMPECPIARQAVPELKRLHAANPKVSFQWIVPGVNANDTSWQRFVRDYKLPFAVVADPMNVSRRRLAVTTSPTAVVLNRRNEVLYWGRIDDRFADVGIQRKLTERSLKLALDAAVAGRRPKPDRTEPVGCLLPKL
ncbi:MAG: hypothetical protein SFX74_10905 [Fimbriimonadaceae bacterium]|nr:hypothetical protein [Fimbriimonadaceae bacterium]